MRSFITPLLGLCPSFYDIPQVCISSEDSLCKYFNLSNSLSRLFICEPICLTDRSLLQSHISAVSIFLVCSRLHSYNMLHIKVLAIFFLVCKFILLLISSFNLPKAHFIIAILDCISLSHFPSDVIMLLRYLNELLFVSCTTMPIRSFPDLDTIMTCF